MAAAAHGESIPFTLVWQNTLYALLYIVLLLLASSAVFSRRNLK
jgi:ABC-type transport system involved in multi-copper enzyme maturation permease subunit